MIVPAGSSNAVEYKRQVYHRQKQIPSAKLFQRSLLPMLAFSAPIPKVPIVQLAGQTMPSIETHRGNQPRGRP